MLRVKLKFNLTELILTSRICPQQRGKSSCSSGSWKQRQCAAGQRGGRGLTASWGSLFPMRLLCRPTSHCLCGQSTTVQITHYNSLSLSVCLSSSQNIEAALSTKLALSLLETMLTNTAPAPFFIIVRVVKCESMCHKPLLTKAENHKYPKSAAVSTAVSSKVSDCKVRQVQWN